MDENKKLNVEGINDADDFIREYRELSRKYATKEIPIVHVREGIYGEKETVTTIHKVARPYMDADYIDPLAFSGVSKVKKVDSKKKKEDKIKQTKKAESWSDFLARYPDIAKDYQMKTAEGEWIKNVEGALEKADVNTQIAAYKLKNYILSKYCGMRLDPDVFYQDLFHYETEGAFKTNVNLKDAPKKVPKKRKNGTLDDKGTIDECSTKSFKKYYARNDAYVPPLKFFNLYAPNEDGVREKKEHIWCNLKTIEKMFAFVVDVDCVLPHALHEFMKCDWSNPINGDSLPKPTYISNSGNGLHLYFVLESPERVFNFNKKGLTDLLNKMQEVFGNQKNGYLSSKKITHFPITQSFRIVGSKSKFGYPVEVYKYSEKWTLEGLCDAFGCEPIPRNSGHAREIRKKKLSENYGLSPAKYRVVKLKDRIIENVPESHIESALDAWSKCAGSAGFSLEEFRKMAVDMLKYILMHEEMDDLFNEMGEMLKKMEKAFRSVGEGLFINCDESVLGFTDSYTPGHTWKCKYIRVLNGIKEEGHIFVGNRYNSIKAAACMASQCGIEREKFEEDMEELWEYIQELSFGWAPFERDEFENAKSFYDKKGKISDYVIQRDLHWSLSNKTPEQKALIKKKADLKAEGKAKEDINSKHMILMLKILREYLEEKGENKEMVYFPTPSELTKFVDGEIYAYEFIDQNTGDDRKAVSGDYYQYWARRYDTMVDVVKLYRDLTGGALDLLNYNHELNPLGIEKEVLDDMKENGWFYFVRKNGDLVKVYFKKTKEEEIECYFKNNPDHSVNQASKELGISRPTVTKYVKKLKEEGRI